MKLAVAMVIFALSGCAFAVGEENFACEDEHMKGSCLPVREMYEATNGPSQSLPVAGAPIVNVAAPVATAAPAVTVIEPVPAEVVNVVPFRSQPVVMRIWVAPWESDAGDLHVGGSLLVEVEPRRWQVGNVGASEQGAIFSPLRKHR